MIYYQQHDIVSTLFCTFIFSPRWVILSGRILCWGNIGGILDRRVCLLSCTEQGGCWFSFLVYDGGEVFYRRLERSIINEKLL